MLNSQNSTSPKKLLQAIQSQAGQLPSNQVFVLDIVSVRFGGYFTQQIKAQFQNFPLLQMLTLNDCGIKSLQYFPLLPGLLRLDLVFNQITGQSLHHLKGSRHLQTLMLGANKIQKFQHLQQLNNMRQLVQLDLINNPVSKLSGYREKMFNIFPTITILDTLDRAGKDAYANTTMTLNASRIPDTLFQRDDPRQIPLFQGPPIQFNGVSGAINKIATKKNRKLTTPINNNSRNQGKMGKLSKISSISRTSHQSLSLFPVGRLKRKLRQAMSGVRISKKSAIYLAGVIQYLSAELVQGAGNVAKNRGKKKISPMDIKQCLKTDQQLNNLLRGVTIKMN